MLVRMLSYQRTTIDNPTLCLSDCAYVPIIHLLTFPLITEHHAECIMVDNNLSGKCILLVSVLNQDPIMEAEVYMSQQRVNVTAFDGSKPPPWAMGESRSYPWVMGGFKPPPCESGSRPVVREAGVRLPAGTQ